MTQEIERLTLRHPRDGEEEELLNACRALAPGGHDSIGLYREGMSLRRYLDVLDEQARGVDLGADRVPFTFLFGFVGERIVGRVSIRHWLNERLAHIGGHIGYVVIPEFRRRGYGTAMLRQALPIARDRLGLHRVLVTCDDDNVASIRIIERCGGVLVNIVHAPDLLKPKRRYWIDLTSAIDSR